MFGQTSYPHQTGKTKGKTAMKVGINLNIEQIFASGTQQMGLLQMSHFILAFSKRYIKHNPEHNPMIIITMLPIWNEKYWFYFYITLRNKELNETKQNKQTNKRMLVAACMYTLLFFQIVSKSIFEV